MDFPFCFCHFHEQFLVLDRNPASQDFHGVLEVAIEEDFAHAIDKRCAGGVQYVECAAKGPLFGRVRDFAEEHEDVPYAELRREGDRVVEKGEVPTSTVCCRLNIECAL